MKIYILSFFSLLCWISTNLFCMLDSQQIEIYNRQLHSAAMYNDIEKLKNLISEKKADVNNKEMYVGSTPLHDATLYGRLNIVELLVANGADTNIQDKLGRTPLHVAMKRQNILIIEKLIEYNANPRIKDKDGYYAHQYLFFNPYQGNCSIGIKASDQFIKSARLLLLEGRLKQLKKEIIDSLPTRPDFLLNLFLIRSIFSEHSQIKQFHKQVLQSYVQLFEYPAPTSESCAQEI